MKTIQYRTTESSKEILSVLTAQEIDFASHWIGDNSINLNGADTVEFIQKRLLSQKYLTINHHPENKKLFVDIGLGGRNMLRITLE